MSAYDELDDWVRTVYGHCTGWIELTLLDTGSKFPKTSHLKVGEWQTLECLQVAELTNVYLGCCTVSRVPEKGRGRYADRLEMPGLWLDIDIGTVGHKPNQQGLRPFADLAEAVSILEACGYPAPTAVIHSGGGIYPWWLFQEPLLMEPETRRDAAQALMDKWNTRATDVAAERGLKLDNISDLPRFLRPPGTWNHKEDLHRPTRLVLWDPTIRYHPNDLWSLVAEVETGRRVDPPSEGYVRSGEPGDGGLADALRGCPWAAILEPRGWSFTGYRGGERNDHEAWTRPGKDTSDNDSALCAPEVMTVFSDAAGLPSGKGRGLTKLRVMAHFYFGGSEGAALADLANAATHGVDQASAPWPECALEKAREAVNMDLEWVRERTQGEALGPVGDMEMVSQTRRRTKVRDETGQEWVVSRGSGFRG